jgi:ABC-type nickel/cobalt efflux system permease component RcnA
LVLFWEPISQFLPELTSCLAVVALLLWILCQAARCVENKLRVKAGQLTDTCLVCGSVPSNPHTHNTCTHAHTHTHTCTHTHTKKIRT